MDTQSDVPMAVKYYAFSKGTSLLQQRRLQPLPVCSTEGFSELGPDTYGGIPPKPHSFDVNSREVLDDLGNVVGKFCDDAVVAAPFPEGCFNGDGEPQEIRCVRIVESEIMAEILNAASDGAWFVLPSQFNGVEYPSDRASIGLVNKLDEYANDRTAGPRGQLAVHPAVGQFLLDNAARHDRPEGLNALDVWLPAVHEATQGFGGYSPFLRNGYLGLPECPAESQNDVLACMRAQLHNVRCLAMRNVPACGLSPSLSNRSKAVHKVNVVYASAVPVQSYLNRGNPSQGPFQQEVGRLMIVAAYCGALRLAAASATEGPVKIFLLPLGGGAFKNSLGAIASAISDSIEWFARDLAPGEHISEKLDIHLLTYVRNPDEAEELRLLLSKLQKL